MTFSFKDLIDKNKEEGISLNPNDYPILIDYLSKEKDKLDEQLKEAIINRDVKTIEKLKSMFDFYEHDTNLFEYITAQMNVLKSYTIDDIPYVVIITKYLNSKNSILALNIQNKFFLDAIHSDDKTFYEKAISALPTEHDKFIDIKTGNYLIGFSKKAIDIYFTMYKIDLHYQNVLTLITKESNLLLDKIMNMDRYSALFNSKPLNINYLIRLIESENIEGLSIFLKNKPEFKDISNHYKGNKIYSLISNSSSENMQQILDLFECNNKFFTKFIHPLASSHNQYKWDLVVQYLINRNDKDLLEHFINLIPSTVNEPFVKHMNKLISFEKLNKSAFQNNHKVSKVKL